VGLSTTDGWTFLTFSVCKKRVQVDDQRPPTIRTILPSNVIQHGFDYYFLFCCCAAKSRVFMVTMNKTLNSACVTPLSTHTPSLLSDTSFAVLLETRLYTVGFLLRR
jgi:hypothetical protein